MHTEDLLANYSSDVSLAWRSGQAKEHAYRPAFQRLMASFPEINAVNDPKRSEHGNPDMVFLKQSKIILAYAETKDIGVNLDAALKSEQLQRYAGYANLLLTNYLDFRFLKNGEVYESISIGKLEDGQIRFDETQYSRLRNELDAFLSQPPEVIQSGQRLAMIMGGKARRIRDRLTYYLTRDDQQNDQLQRIFNLMREALLHDLTIGQFADMYAQTLVYGLFVARFNDKTPDSFSRGEARDLVPATNPFLREFFDHIVGPHFDKRLGHIVDELCEVFSVSDVLTIVQKHLYQIATDEKDPIIHFYEDFLQEYDPLERKKMGAYYTPVPIVKYIVSQVDQILRNDFSLPRGLADDSKRTIEVETGQDLRHDRRMKPSSKILIETHKVQLLDPAVGTATFLNEVIHFIHDAFIGQEGRWSNYVKEDLIPRLNGFELMMAPYTIAHLKLGMTLRETGVENLKDRLGIYLTNTLEQGIPNQLDLFNFGLAQAVTEESRAAGEIKNNRPIMVVLGNPPYSGISSNETPFANGLVDRYKVEPGGNQKLIERKHWLNDDYVKFIAFAEEMIERNGKGIIAMITNNGYLDNPTFRGMRWHLTQSFDKIFVLDLHGNAKKREVSPDGSKDENVFDIMQGVSIMLAIKTSPDNTPAQVWHAELFGKRADKFKALGSNQEWEKLSLDKNFVFKPLASEGLEDYQEGISINDLFLKGTSGIQTSRDKFIVDFDRKNLVKRLNEFTNTEISDDEIRTKYFTQNGDKYPAGDTRGWRISEARHALHQDVEQIIRQYSYRPFDNRLIAYDVKLIDWPRYNVMRHLLQPNTSLTVGRQGQAVGPGDWNLVYIQNTISDLNLFYRGGGVVFPLYLYHENGSRTPNFQPTYLRELMHNLPSTPSAEEAMDYIYAILHSPKYRQKFEVFLKSDFPKIPRPKDVHSFERLVKVGKALRAIHLMLDADLGAYDSDFPISGDNEVKKVIFKENRVYINEHQYFENIPTVAWNFHIGGYCPAQKWLKDRKNRALSSSEVDYYQKIIRALIKTQELMLEIDSQTK